MSEYKQRDIQALGGHYDKHARAMTAEGLYRKSQIAAELAWRDSRIEELQAALAEVDAAFSDLGRELIGNTFGEEDNLFDTVKKLLESSND